MKIDSSHKMWNVSMTSGNAGEFNKCPELTKSLGYVRHMTGKRSRYDCLLLILHLGCVSVW